MNLTKTPYLVLFILLAAVGVGAASAVALVTIDNLKVTGDMELDGKLIDANDGAGTSGQVLVSTSNGVEWVDVESLLPGIPESCAEHYDLGERMNGLYAIKIGNDPILTVFCDMTTDDGGWTLVYSASSSNQNVLGNEAEYFFATDAVLNISTEVLVGYRDSENNFLPGYARLNLPTNWKIYHPLSTLWLNVDEAVNVFIDGSSSSTGTTLRYGVATFSSSTCNSNWDTGLYGRLCFVGTNAVFYSAYAHSGGDFCSLSHLPFTAVPCSNDRVFTIAVR